MNSKILQWLLPLHPTSRSSSESRLWCRCRRCQVALVQHSLKTDIRWRVFHCCSAHHGSLRRHGQSQRDLGHELSTCNIVPEWSKFIGAFFQWATGTSPTRDHLVVHVVRKTILGEEGASSREKDNVVLHSPTLFGTALVASLSPPKFPEKCIRPASRVRFFFFKPFGP